MDTEILLEWLFITPEGALATVIATTVMYLLVILVSRILGARVLTGLTSFDMLAGIIFGAIVGRATLGPGPTLTTGIIAFLTLVALQGTIGQIAHTKRGEHWVNNQPLLLYAGSKPLEDVLRKTRISRDELQSKLRLAGIQSNDQISAIILEPTGEISILTSDRLIDHGLVDDVIGKEKIPRGLIRWTKEANAI